MRKFLLVLFASVIIAGLGGQTASAHVKYDHASELDPFMTISDLGSAMWNYDNEFVDTKSYKIWHFIVWTPTSSADYGFQDDGSGSLEFDGAFYVTFLLYGYKTVNSGWTHTNEDHELEAVGEVNAVPEPATLLLLGSGLVGLGLSRRRK